MPSKLTMIGLTAVALPVYLLIVVVLFAVAATILVIGLTVSVVSSPTIVYNAIYRHFEDKYKLTK